MKATLTIAVTALSSLCLLTTSCRKQKGEARFFADRHWHRSDTKITTCYKLNSNIQIATDTSVTGFDTVFAIKKVEDNSATGINFLGFTLWRYEHGVDSVIDYIYSGGHEPGAQGFMLSYSGKHNRVYCSMFDRESIVTDSAQQTSCRVRSYTTWSSYQ